MAENVNTVTVTIPVSFLLTLAVYGNMGDGDLPKFMQIWAEQECDRLGLNDAMLRLKSARYDELRERVRMVFGSNTIEQIETAARKVAPAIVAVTRSER